MSNNTCVLFSIPLHIFISFSLSLSHLHVLSLHAFRCFSFMSFNLLSYYARTITIIKPLESSTLVVLKHTLIDPEGSTQEQCSWRPTLTGLDGMWCWFGLFVQCRIYRHYQLDHLEGLPCSNYCISSQTFSLLETSFASNSWIFNIIVPFTSAL